jgi:hypothetical protein
LVQAASAGAAADSSQCRLSAQLSAQAAPYFHKKCQEVLGLPLSALSLVVCAFTQDVNPVTYQLLMSQRCTVVLVGDKHQHIYGFNNAMDALAAAALEPNRPKRSFTLSHSFR